MQQPVQQSPEQTFRVVTNLWFAFIETCVIFAGIAYLTKGAGADAAPTNYTTTSSSIR